MELLQTGSPAPQFIAQTVEGKAISLKEYRGQLVWLIFYRYPGCPMCNLHMSALMLRKPVLNQLGLKVIAVFESGAEKFPKDLGGKKRPDFPLIADPEKKLYQLYRCPSRLSGVVHPGAGVSFLKAITSGFKQPKVEGSLGQIPCHFLIAEDGILEHTYYGRHIGDHIPWTTVDKFVRDRRGGTWNNTVVL